jgi:uncharacterized membrane protein YtjA (UPF0391 family)
MDVMQAPSGDRPDVAAGNLIQQGRILALHRACQTLTANQLLSRCGFGTAHVRNQFHSAKLDRRFRDGRGSKRPEAGGAAMTILKWALIFFVVSIIAGILGFTGISAASADVARFLFYVFVVIFLVLLILGLTIFRV